MRQATPSHVRDASAGVLLRLRSILTRPIRLERRGIDWHFVFEPLPRPASRTAGVARSGEASARRRDAMPSMTSGQLAEVCANLRTMLGGDVGRHPRQPSLALLERALVKDGVRGIDDVPPAVLRHAAQTLDTVELDQYGPGLVVLRRRIEQVLRRRHGDRHTHESSTQPMPLAPLGQPVERVQRAMPDERLQRMQRAAPALSALDRQDFSESLTEFIDLDKMFGGLDS
jgi:hypothetical protein